MISKQDATGAHATRHCRAAAWYVGISVGGGTGGGKHSHSARVAAMPALHVGTGLAMYGWCCSVFVYGGQLWLLLGTGTPAVVPLPPLCFPGNASTYAG